ncbi:ORF6N domain-containing protein [Providencia sp. PROV221]|uniref:ORF6N domain-containing protein n=1 Tax=Providencia sp. PROV221 TaxID=2949916 RepID=UPI00234ABC48|nr:ORF6N domain-containing protein [Providencia sp. PROV221]
MNNVSNINETSNSVKSMPLIAHSGAPVITTDMLADVYGTEVINIQVNHSRNKNRFIEGKHFYKLTGSILKEFKNWLTKSKLVYKGSEIISKHAKSIILWTERGAARHAKMLDTDNAWDVFEALEDFYFAKKEDAQQKISLRQSTAKELTPLRQTAERLIATGVGNIYPDIWKYVHKEFGVEHINELLPEQIPQAISYLNALEGEYIPRTEQPAENVTDNEIARLLVVRNRFDKALSIWKDNLCRNLIRMDVPSAVPFNQAVTDAISELRFITDKLSERLIA